MFVKNQILQTDAYKLTHYKQYPEKTEKVYSYLESRGGMFDSTVFFGLQAILLDNYSNSRTENRITPKKVDEAEEVANQIFGYKYFNREGWDLIVNEHQGLLPLKIKAVQEGTVVPTRNVLMTIENTDPRLPWLTNFVESQLLQVWYPITVATLSHEIKKLIKKYANQTGVDEVGVCHLNDFGFRGTSSHQSASIGGAAHLLSFMGTDNLEAIRFIDNYYIDPQVSAASYALSVMATEHSTTTIYGEENEEKAYDRFIEITPDDAILSVVADSYDFFNAVDYIIGQKLMDKIITRKGRFIVRPDSGHPPHITVQCLDYLANRFPSKRVTKNGYKLLNEKVGIIYGDWMSYDMIEEVCQAMIEAGFAVHPDNVVFGMGGKLLQQVNRDTQKFAIKCSHAEIDGKPVDVFKRPKTDLAQKSSKRGKLKLIRIEDSKGENVFKTVPESHPGEDVLETVFLNGEVVKTQTFGEIKNILNR